MTEKRKLGDAVLPFIVQKTEICKRNDVFLLMKWWFLIHSLTLLFYDAPCNHANKEYVFICKLMRNFVGIAALSLLAVFFDDKNVF